MKNSVPGRPMCQLGNFKVSKVITRFPICDGSRILKGFFDNIDRANIVELLTEVTQGNLKLIRSSFESRIWFKGAVRTRKKN